MQAHLASTDKLLTDVVVTQRQIEACLPGYVPSSHDDLPESSAAAADAYHAVPAEPELASAVHAEHAEQNKPEIEVEVAVPLGSAEAEHNVGSAQAVPELLQPGLAQSIAKSSAADMSPDVRPAWQPSSSKYGQGASSSQGPMPEQAHSPPAASPARPSRPAHANPVRQPGVQFPPPPDFPDIQLPVSPDFSNVHFPPSPDHSHAPFPAFPEFPAFPTFPDYAAGSGAPGLDELRDYVSSTVDAATGFASAAAGFGAAAASSFMPRPYHHRNRPSRRGYRNRSRSSDSSSNSTASSTSSDSSRGSSSSSSSESSSSTAGGGRAPVSPLPAMMIELQDAMTASDSRAGELVLTCCSRRRSCRVRSNNRADHLWSGRNESRVHRF